MMVRSGALGPNGMAGRRETAGVRTVFLFSLLVQIVFVLMVHIANFGVTFLIAHKLPAWLLTARFITVPLLLVDVAIILTCLRTRPPIKRLVKLQRLGYLCVRVCVPTADALSPGYPDCLS